MNQLELLSAWTQNNVETSLFYLFAILSIPLAFGVIFDRAIIRSGFMLIGVFGTISGMFLVLQAQFLALAQVMIYAVGITLVVVIALMLTNPKLESEESASIPNQKLGGFLVAAFLFFTIYLALRSESWPISSGAVSADNVQTIGLALVTSYSLPFEFASVLLLAALMGAILLAKVEPAAPALEKEPGEQGDTRQVRLEREKTKAGV
jgi:NADH:ubiquinone oxidoreductase subunit 6 (subunit J)